MPDEIKCPKCSSTQITATKKGFSGTKAVGGAILTGGIGLLAGLHGSGDIIVHCLACGDSWNPKKVSEDKKRDEGLKKMKEENKDFFDVIKWRKDVLNAYETNDKETATALFLSKREFNDKTRDIDQASQVLRHEDNVRKIANRILIFIVAVGVIWLLSLISK